ncbi:glycosyltransferase family 4 protein [Gordonia desulfuricans]|uniref:Glycosyltransferase family 4 protein n=1 Tax=Gordonia desulfuricans TaxID=89051 RepID=A0A7K3LL20_9ACTN|nr:MULTISPECIES: glycosyltransferase family 4 protein [Gordonia]EMP11557.2 glycosyl transferase [Gordonia sp. NB41Y]NDK88918.1 glycosyltransferase family 4 protein [Gordonia desulfuricans]WLP88929.1 glycosyltransferase family 4 protein [Gordonia sp. NB41Y]
MTPPSRVLLLCWRDTGHPQGGGSERYLESVGRELAARGSDVTLVTAQYPGAPRTEHRDGVRILRAGGRLGVYPRALLTILAGRLGRGPLAGYAPDVVIDTQNGMPFFATLVTRAPTILLVHHCHREQWPVAGRALGHLGWFLESRVSPWVHRRNHYVTVSAPSKRELVDLGVDDGRITVIRNGLDPVPAGIPPRPAGPDGPVRMCVLSRLVPHKQVEHALIALADLRRAGVDVELDVIGGGWWSDELISRARDLGVDEAVDFHGHVTETVKHQILARARVHLMPSRKEGWGLAVMEAAQHGVPTIGYRSSVGLMDSVEDGKTGLLVDGIDEFTSAARKLIDNPDEASRLGDAAHRKSQRYSWGATADEMLSVFARLWR